jgi:integrase
MIRSTYADLRQSGRVRGGGGLSAKTVHNIHRTLSRALDDAVEDRMIARNPAKGAHSAPESPVQGTWDAAQLRRFLDHVQDDRLFALWRLAVTTGMRRGELVGLRWSDVNFARRHLTVTQQRAKGHGTVHAGPTKTRKSRRRVALDIETVEALRAHRKQQDAKRESWGAAYQVHGLVFCMENGQPLHPDSITKRRIAKALGLPWAKLHGLRHSYATLLLEAGVI